MLLPYTALQCLSLQHVQGAWLGDLRNLLALLPALRDLEVLVPANSACGHLPGWHHGLQGRRGTSLQLCLRTPRRAWVGRGRNREGQA